MNYRKLGSTGKLVSEIGFGAWQLGNAKDWQSMTDLEAIRLVHEALDLGVNFFDTAPNYGLGKSEELLGKALKNRRDQVVISTKYGHSRHGHTNFDVNNIETSLNDSLKTLQTDYVDSLLLHNPPMDVLNGSLGHFEVLEDLKKAGKIASYGVSVDSSREMFEVIRHTKCQVMEVMYNLFHQETNNAFAAASDKGIGLIIKVPLDSGFLTGKYNKQSAFNDIRSRWSKEVIERRFTLLEEIKSILNDDSNLVLSALKFILANEEVSTVIPGNKNSHQLHTNVKSIHHSLNQETIMKLREFYDEYLKNNPLPW